MQKILVCIDGSEISERIISKAVEKAKKDGSKIIVLYVVEDFCPIGLAEVDCKTIRELLIKEGKNIIDSAVNKFKSQGLEVNSVIKEGRPADVIIDFAKEEKVDEIFIGSHGKHGAKKFFQGSVSSRVVEGAPCPVTVIK
ncbi:MAG: universal stress protein [Thermodesulfovibrio sp.]|nr:universal stress protein [Thermodesulfovibrio sp.]MDW7998765.1 universal stress protein [Thermodesulfovibrio sp.]